MLHKKRNRLVAGIIFVLLVLVGFACYQLLYPPFHLDQTSYIYIDRDDTPDSIFNKVKRVGKVDALYGWSWIKAFDQQSQEMHSGRFAIYPTDNAIRLYHRIANGRQEPINLSFNNIRTRERLARTLGKQLMIDSVEVATMLFDSAFCAKMGYNRETVVSMFIPNTYHIYWDISVEDLFKRMKKEHHSFWNEERRAKAKALDLTPEEIATLASIVEEETNNASEKPMVAGLYLNRLRKGMLLQADPTVKFALQNFELKRIWGAHLTVDSPYNTYKCKGLPPGPIRIPSIKGLESVLNHATHDYIYMCAKEDFSGTHNFTANYAEHQANGRRYRQALDKRNIQ